MDMVRIYVDLMGPNLQDIADQSERWRQRDRVDTIIIPVQLGTNWIIYTTERHSRIQKVLRITRGVRRDADLEAVEGLAQLDLLMLNVGRGDLDIWLRLLMRDITVQQVKDRGVREDLQHDIRNEEFRTTQSVHFDASEVTPGVLCIYFIQVMLTTANC
jgi:hypothetical protein